MSHSALADALYALAIRHFRIDARAVRPATGSVYKMDAPITQEAFEHHLNGGPAVGWYFVKPGETTCNALVFDLDSHRGQIRPPEMRQVVSKLVDVLGVEGYLPYVFSSYGGRGAHVYVLFQDPQDAGAVRAEARRILNSVGLREGTGGVGVGEVEVFPKQDRVVAGGYGNMVVAPLAGRSQPLDLLELKGLPRETLLTDPPQLSRGVPPAPAGAGAGRPPPPPAAFTLTDKELAIIRSALGAFPNDDRTEVLGYDVWLKLLFAVHHGTAGAPAGLELMRELSARSPRHEDGRFPGELEKQWAFAKLGRPDSITIRTLFAEARVRGWSTPPELVFDKVVEELEDRLDRYVADMRSAGALETEEEPLPEPMPLWGAAVGPHYRHGLAPAVMETWVDEQAQASGLDPAGYLAAGVAVALAAVPLRVRMGPNRADPTWKTPLINWAALVGRPGTGKTPIVNAALRPVADYNALLIKGDQMQMRAWEAACAGLKPGQPKPPRPGRHRRLVTGGTLEGIMDVMSEDGTGLIYVRDELEGFYNGMAQYKDGGQGDDKQIWLQAWNGGTLVNEQVRRGTRFVDAWGPSLLGGIQPDRMNAVAMDSVEDGMLPRTCMVVLDDRESVVRRVIAEQCGGGGGGGGGAGVGTGTAEYDRVIKQLMTLGPLELRFTDAAQCAFTAEVLQVRGLAQGITTASPGVSLHLQKWGTLLARHAAGFHLLYHCTVDPLVFLHGLPLDVDLPALELARDYLTWEAKHVWAFYRDSASPVMKLAREIADYVLIHGVEELERRELTRSLKSGWFKASGYQQRDAIHFLLDSGWLLHDSSRKNNRRGSSAGDGTRWRVNPKVFSIYQQRVGEEKTRRSQLHASLQAKFMH